MAASMDNLFVREIERQNGEILRVNQSGFGDVGCVVWDAALVLLSYLETPDFVRENGKNMLENKRVIELGSGTGAVGLQAACCGADTVITDLKDFVPLMELNIKTNKELVGDKIQARELNWEEPCQEFGLFDFVLLADCIYYEASLEPLVQTIRQVSGDHTTVLCCFEERMSGDKPRLQQEFFRLIEEAFHVEKVPLERQDKFFRSEDIHIMKFFRRQASDTG